MAEVKVGKMPSKLRSCNKAVWEEDLDTANKHDIDNAYALDRKKIQTTKAKDQAQGLRCYFESG